MIDFKVGIMGAGNIAGTVAETLNNLDAFVPYAVASRDINKAREFGDKYYIGKCYGSYEEMINDPDVELIYIATPHAFHAEQAKMCINAGKPVLVEKSFSYNLATAEEVLKLSEEKNVFCGEAMWMRFLPMYQLMKEYIDKGLIGNVRCLNCSLGYDLKSVERLTDPQLAGGALLDLGVYILNLVAVIFGPQPFSVTSSCATTGAGVDCHEVMQFIFKNGAVASGVATFLYKADNTVKIYGDRGYIEIDNLISPNVFRIYQGDGKMVVETKLPDRQISGYEFEFLAARDAIILGKTYCEEMPHSETLRIMKLMDMLRNAWKIKFPME